MNGGAWWISLWCKTRSRSLALSPSSSRPQNVPFFPHFQTKRHLTLRLIFIMKCPIHDPESGAPKEKKRKQNSYRRSTHTPWSWSSLSGFYACEKRSKDEHEKMANKKKDLITATTGGTRIADFGLAFVFGGRRRSTVGLACEE